MPKMAFNIAPPIKIGVKYGAPLPANNEIILPGAARRPNVPNTWAWHDY